MRIITTFNDRLYELSGRYLLDSLKRLLPEVEVLIYHETYWDCPPLNSVRVSELPAFREVFERNKDIITHAEGGEASADNMDYFLRRWFNWFRKIVAQHDAIVHRPFEGYTLFLDCDVRVVAPFDQHIIEQQLHKAVGIFKGLRETIETGIVMWDGTKREATEFIESVMDWYFSGKFRALNRWDDSQIFTECVRQYPDTAQDFASGLKAATHTNSNGHTTVEQIIPLTIWGKYFEHDKGMHSRRGILNPP